MSTNDAASSRDCGARAHWDRVYSAQAVDEIPEDDDVGAAARKHFGDLAGRRLLDLGCGAGEYSLFFARAGANVTAVDTSAVAVSHLQEYCGERGITNVRAVVSDAFDIAALGPFDAAFGSMILHHLEPFDRFVDVLADSLDPGGRAFFYENSAMSRTLVWCREHLAGRFGIPKYGDDDEFPLQPQEVDAFRRRFDVDVEYPELFLARLASAYVLRGHGEEACAWIDEKLYRFPRVRRLSYRQYVRLARR